MHSEHNESIHRVRAHTSQLAFNSRLFFSQTSRFFSSFDIIYCSATTEYQLLFDSPDELARFYFACDALVADLGRQHAALMRTALTESASGVRAPLLPALPALAAAAPSPSPALLGISVLDRIAALEVHNPLRSTALVEQAAAATLAAAAAAASDPPPPPPADGGDEAASAPPPPRVPQFHTEYPTIPASLKINVVTWNTAGKMPLDADFPLWLPVGGGDFDIVAVGASKLQLRVPFA